MDIEELRAIAQAAQDKAVEDGYEPGEHWLPYHCIDCADDEPVNAKFAATFTPAIVLQILSSKD